MVHITEHPDYIPGPDPELWVSDEGLSVEETDYLLICANSAMTPIAEDRTLFIRMNLDKLAFRQYHLRAYRMRNA